LELPESPQVHCRLVLGVNHFLDMCRTVVNVTGDLGIAALVAKGEGDAAADGLQQS